MMTAHDMPQRVATIIAEALNVPLDRVTSSASLIDDLGAESIDFLDILFRIETAFNIKIHESELWSGSIDRTSPETIAASIEQLKQRQPDYRWDRMPSQPVPSDLPRLITVQTIINHLHDRGIE
jgi:acyl carrier protein